MCAMITSSADSSAVPPLNENTKEKNEDPAVQRKKIHPLCILVSFSACASPCSCASSRPSGWAAQESQSNLTIPTTWEPVHSSHLLSRAVQSQSCSDKCWYHHSKYYNHIPNRPVEVLEHRRDFRRNVKPDRQHWPETAAPALRRGLPLALSRRIRYLPWLNAEFLGTSIRDPVAVANIHLARSTLER